MAMAMPNDAPAAASPTNLAPDSHAASTARKAVAPMTVAAAFRARVARKIRPIAVTRSRVPRTACTASATGPSATAAAKAAKIPFPWCSAGTSTYRFTHIPRPYSRSSITAALNALIRSPLPPRPASGAGPSRVSSWLIAFIQSDCMIKFKLVPCTASKGAAGRADEAAAPAPGGYSLSQIARAKAA